MQTAGYEDDPELPAGFRGQEHPEGIGPDPAVVVVVCFADEDAVRRKVPRRSGHAACVKQEVRTITIVKRQTRGERPVMRSEIAVARRQRHPPAL